MFEWRDESEKETGVQKCLASLKKILNHHYRSRVSHRFYYPPEVTRVKYCGLGVFLLQYFLPVAILSSCHCINERMNIFNWMYDSKL